MKFDPGKAWPHPVLRPSSNDYPHAEFEVEMEVRRVMNSTAVLVRAEFELSDPGLLDLVEDGAARYMLLVKASRTHYRETCDARDPLIERSYRPGELAGRIELTPFLVSTCELAAFRSDAWHEDFLGLTFDLPPGAVLASDVSKEYWVDTAEEAPLGAIFGHRSNANMADGTWSCVPDEDFVWIEMSVNDSARFQNARNRANGTPEGYYLINGIYLPALVSLLYEVDRSREEFEERRWFASLDRRLEAVGSPLIGSSAADRLADAQRVLESPFKKMPLVLQGEMT